MTKGSVRPAKFVQNSLLPIVGTGVEFGGHDCGQDGALEDPSILAEPQAVFSTVEPDVNAGIEQRGLGRQ